MNRDRSGIGLEIIQEHCCFVKDTETRNVIFMIWISEREIQMHMDLCFIDYVNENLFGVLGKLDL